MRFNTFNIHPHFDNLGKQDLVGPMHGLAGQALIRLFEQEINKIDYQSQ